MTEQVVGNWILETPLASGGMGTVYRARHKTLGTPAAVKVLQPQLVGTDEMQQRFEREAAIQARLEHPNVARVLDYHEQDGSWFLVMEFLTHGCLTDRIREANGPLPLEPSLSWVRQALAGLSYAHQNGIVHRDIKPDNLLLDAHGQVKVADFGIARDLSLTRMTQTGTTLGTPHYMSPEQLLRPDEVDERSDIYAMGIVLYELLAGSPPFEGSSFFAISQAKVEKDPPPLSRFNPGVPPALDGILHKAIARAPEDRYASCAAFLQSLEAVAAGQDLGLPHTPTIASGIQSPESTQFHTGVPSDFHTPPPPPKPRHWKMPAIGLAMAALVAIGLSQMDLTSGRTDQAALGRVLQEAHRAEATADVAGTAGEDVRFAADEAQAAAQKALDEPTLPAAPGHVGLAKGLLEQARVGSEKVREAADHADEARRAAERAASEGGVDLATPSSYEPELVKVLPRSDDDARRAARDAVEVARRESSRATEVVQETDDAIQQADDWISQAEKEIQNAQARIAQAHLPTHQGLAMPGDIPGSSPGAGVPSAGVPSAGVPSAGVPSAGVPSAGVPSAGVPSAGIPGTLPGSVPGMPPGAGFPPAGTTPPFPTGPLPEQPTVAVLAHGDPVLAGSFEQELERRLSRARFDIQDEHNSMEISRKLQSIRPPEAQELAQDLLRSGFHVLVMIRVEEAERRHLEFRSQRGNAVGARLRINAYNLTTGRPIGRGWSEIVEYTELSAGAKAKRALLKESSELASNIRAAWKKIRPA